MATQSFSTFKLGERQFGIDILFVREINRHLEITPMQHVSDFIRGIVNLRGQIVTVFDLHRRLGGEKHSINQNSCNLILKTDQELNPIREREGQNDLRTTSESVGFLVDQIGSVITVPSDEIIELPADTGFIDRKYLSGVIKQDSSTISIINVPRVLMDEQTNSPGGEG